MNALPHTCRRAPRWLVLLALAALAACSPTEGTDDSFVPVQTTNTDFGDPVFVPVGNEPITMDVTVSGLPLRLDLVAVVNRLGNAQQPITELPDGTITILQRTGSANFNVTDTLITEIDPGLVRWGDFDGNADLDVVVLDNSGTRVAVYLATGPGTFAPSGLPDFAVTFTAAVAQMDVVDLAAPGGRSDILLTVPASGFIVALKGPGPSFTVHITDVGTDFSKPSPGKFVTGEFGPGTTLEVATLHPALDEVNFWSWDVRTPPEDSVFTAITEVTVDDLPSFIAAGDLDGVGDTDVAVVSLTSEIVTVLQNDGGGAFSVLRTIAVSEDPRQIFAADLATDTAGDDLVVLHFNERFVSFIKDPAVSFSTSTLETTKNPIDVDVGDITGDANPDMAVAESNKRAVGIFAGDGTGGFSRTVIGFTSKVTFPRLVDVDGDTDLDLLLLQPNSDRLVVLLNVNP